MLCMLSLSCIQSAAAQHCHLAMRGKVIERENGEVLPWATVYIREIKRGANTDESGRFVLNDLCEDSVYTVEIRHLQCEHFTQIIKLTENTELSFALSHYHDLKEVLVREKAIVAEPTQAHSKVDALDLAAGRGLNLGESLRRLPGVSLLSTGATIAKPVIQGLHSNRVALVINGVVLEGQQWGLEHAPEIDPFAVDQISVVKGAAGVRYGVSALAGAVVMEHAPLRAQAGLGGWFTTQYFSNGRGGILAGQMDWHLPEKKASFRVQGTAKRLGNLKAPDYWLGNSGQQEFNLSAIASWQKKRWSHELIASTFNQKIAVLRAGHVGSLSDVDLAIASDTPRNNPNFFTYRINRPYQAVQHNTLKYKAVWRISDIWKLSLQHYVQYNYRQEYDVVRKTGTAAERPQVTFSLLHNTSDAMLEHFPIRHWQGGVGAQLMHAFNQVGRGGFIPDYQSFGTSVWWHERWRRHPLPWEFEFGMRADYRQTAAQTSGSLQNLDTAVHFATFSGNVGWIYHVNTRLRFAFNSGLAMRPPHVNELFARGVDFLLANYRSGQSNMVNEKAWNNNLTMSYQKRNILLSLSVFRNTIYDFIYLNPSGQKVLTVRGSFPEYVHTQTQRAVLQGFEGQLELPLMPRLLLETNASILRAFRLTTENPGKPNAHAWLPLMPPDRFQYGLRWQGKTIGSDPEKKTDQRGLTLRLFASTSLRQSRLPLEGLLKPAPAGFTTLNADASCYLPLGKKQLELGLLLRNIGNVRYREYLNFFRFYADEPGFNLGVRLKVTFNDSL